MPNADAQHHIYQRTVSGNGQDSLSIIAGLIEPGQTVLDLGMGAGGLGQFLSQRQSVVADGVSLNPAEAEMARTWYRQALVADLDRDDLTMLFAGQQYDCIVCADVLEHLKAPQHVLAQCKTLLKPGGRLLTSIPNAGYCGLVAELIQGDFRYRPEGLLDSTHLRFFTRTSLQRFFHENSWVTKSIKTTKRNLLESEFTVAFDSLPPAVARYLLAQPDALTYQFITVLHLPDPVPESEFTQSMDALDTGETSSPAAALFSSQLYLAIEGKFAESIKLVVPGRMGEPQQSLEFEIPATQHPYTLIRFDPADRPGFLRLHQVHVSLPDGQLLWQWISGVDSLAILLEAPKQQMLISSAWEISSDTLLMLHGDDPWIELPFSPELLQQISDNGATLQMTIGWPMSADYLQASAAVNALQINHQHDLDSLHEAIKSLKQEQQFELDQRQVQIAQYLGEFHGQQEQIMKQRVSFDATRDELLTELDTLNNALMQTQDAKLKLIVALHSAQRERNAFMAQFSQIAQHLHVIEQSTVFRATRPLVHLKMEFDRYLGMTGKQSQMLPLNDATQILPISKHPVDIIVPVFRGLDDTRLCLEAVLSANCQTRWRLIVINDCSPEPEVTEWLRSFAQRDSRISLLENHENLGFVATVNRGMALSQENDVLLLNSDAEVANDWLDRIQHAAYSRLNVASVTPFSNNATICSYPRFCQPNELPAGHDTASLDRLFAEHLPGQAVEVPTGVGFCMYIRRQCLQEVGLFDVHNFGKGYGEENDFCVRAQQAGWINLHALDVFVRHAGGISFGESKSARELQAMETLRRMHPRYEGDVHLFVQADPAQPARLQIDMARIVNSGHPVILNVMHDRQGGTLRHVQDLALQLIKKAIFLRLTPANGGAELRMEGVHEGFALHFSLPSEQPRLLATLIQLQVGHIHYHHLLGHAPSITELPDQLGVTHDFTAHDYYSYCPQISLTDHTERYCGEQGIEQCHQCLKRNPAPRDEGIETWRDRHGRLLSQARYVIAPSLDAAHRMKRFVPTAHVRVVPHATLHQPIDYPQPSPRLLPIDQPLKIVVLGALSKIKGADVLEEVAILAARHHVQIELHLLGYAYRNLRTQPKARLTVHGGYEEKDLPLLLQWLKPDAVWFPAVWPETYSYTLSASLESGLPIIAPNIGAFTERVHNRPWTWLCDWQQSAVQWLEFFGHIRQHHFCTGVAPAPAQKAVNAPHLEAPALDYGSGYLHSLPLPKRLSTAELHQLREQVVPHLYDQSVVLKSLTLRALTRLRASRALSPIARIVSPHLQRRVKSWLGK